jgi:hypothetical protein
VHRRHLAVRPLAALVIATSTAACGARSLDVGGPDLTHLGACPLRTPGEWQAFVARTAQGPQWVETCDDGVCTQPYQAVEETVASVFQQCAGFLAYNPSIDACANNLRRFTSSWMQQHDRDTYGFTKRNDAYFAAQSGPDMPEGMMVPPATLLAPMPNLASVEDAARSNGWPWVVQDSCLGNVRIYFLRADPLGRFDQWILMNLRAGTMPVEVAGRVSFLAVQKTDAAGTLLPAVRVHFRDYLVKPSPGGGYSLTSDALDNAKCYSCHPSGVRRLIGERTPDLDAKPVMGEPMNVPMDFAFQRLTALNARLASYGLNDWNGDIVVEDHGPALGAAQGCTACHDGHIRGVLTVSTSQRQLKHKVVTELSMPPTPGLTEQEHAALLADLEAASQPELEAWLQQTRCDL